MARGRSRGFRRQVRRKFVWHREIGAFTTTSSGPGTWGYDLLAGFRALPGATHLGSTVMRVRGYIVPELVDPLPSEDLVAGLRVDTWDQSVTTSVVSPYQGVDEDWMAWFPYLSPSGAPDDVTGNIYASPYAVDVKSSRKLEELNETLWLFGSTPGGTSATYHFNLSVGLKLP